MSDVDREDSVPLHWLFMFGSEENPWDERDTTVILDD